MKTYFVIFRLFNGENKGWAYKEEKVDDFNVAMQKYGNLIETYFGKAPFVYGYLALEDNEGIRHTQTSFGEVPTPSEEE